MLTAAILVGFGILFAAFALLGPAERSRGCGHARPGDPKCQECSPDLLDRRE